MIVADESGCPQFSGLLQTGPGNENASSTTQRADMCCKLALKLFVLGLKAYRRIICPQVTYHLPAGHLMRASEWERLLLPSVDLWERLLLPSVDLRLFRSTTILWVVG
jgi:hypothetical protein